MAGAFGMMNSPAIDETSPACMSSAASSARSGQARGSAKWTVAGALFGSLSMIFPDGLNCRVAGLGCGDAGASGPKEAAKPIRDVKATADNISAVSL
ncbi:hypothetical protein AB4Z10_18620 [Bosea sp. RAF48]|uniref:hypothetical protein n=1 Tax=Bosea sp. RAF48 TaxID=3237480 RepID=UPI003F9203A0